MWKSVTREEGVEEEARAAFQRKQGGDFDVRNWLPYS